MQTTRLIIVAVGGQGNLLASRILGEAALMADIPVHMSEIHGMAQRGGVVESAILFGDVQSNIISDGEADILMSFEPAEALRAIRRCNSNSVVITNLAPLPPFTAAIGRGVYPEIDRIRELIAANTRRLIALDATRLAGEAGNVMAVNMVLLGALIQTNLLPLTADQIRTAIRTRTKASFVDINIKAFDIGMTAAARPEAPSC